MIQPEKFHNDDIWDQSPPITVDHILFPLIPNFWISLYLGLVLLLCYLFFASSNNEMLIESFAMNSGMQDLWDSKIQIVKIQDSDLFLASLRFWDAVLSAEIQLKFPESHYFW